MSTWVRDAVSALFFITTGTLLSVCFWQIMVPPAEYMSSMAHFTALPSPEPLETEPLLEEPMLASNASSEEPMLPFTDEVEHKPLISHTGSICQRAIKEGLSSCQDEIFGQTIAPMMTVVHAPAYDYAISQHPVTKALYATYCAHTDSCEYSGIEMQDELDAEFRGLLHDYQAMCLLSGGCGHDVHTTPVVGLSLQEISAFLAWLNEMTQQSYRLPTIEEWLYAISDGMASSDGYVPCSLLSQQGMESWGPDGLSGPLEWITQNGQWRSVGDLSIKQGCLFQTKSVGQTQTPLAFRVVLD